MSKRKRPATPAPDRQLFVRSERRNPPDLRKLSRALIALAMAEAQAEADAQAEHSKKLAEDTERAA